MFTLKTNVIKVFDKVKVKTNQTVSTGSSAINYHIYFAILFVTRIALKRLFYFIGFVVLPVNKQMTTFKNQKFEPYNTFNIGPATFINSAIKYI